MDLFEKVQQIGEISSKSSVNVQEQEGQNLMLTSISNKIILRSNHLLIELHGLIVGLDLEVPPPAIY